MVAEAPELERELALLGSFTLPDYRTLAEARPADPWLWDNVILPIMRRREDGLPLHRLMWLEMTRGAGKTGTIMRTLITKAMLNPGTLAIVIAGDLDMAKLSAEVGQGECFRNPKLTKYVVPGQLEFRIPHNGSRIRIMSSDAPSFYGQAVDCQKLIIVCDELTTWQKRDLYDAAMSTLPKIHDSQLIVITNSGIIGSWQETAKAAMAKSGAYVYDPEGVLASWISPEDLALVEANLPPAKFNQLYRGLWVGETSGFTPISWWDDLKDESIPELDDKTPVIVGVDAAYTNDSFGMVAVARDRLSPKDSVEVRWMRIWEPKRGERLDFSEGPDAPMNVLADFCRSHRVLEVDYDVFQLYDPMNRFRRLMLANPREFSQQGDRARADTALYGLIRDGRIGHNGDEKLREHIGNCDLKITANDTRARLVKKAPDRKIDLAVCMSMAASRVLFLNL